MRLRVTLDEGERIVEGLSAKDFEPKTVTDADAQMVSEDEERADGDGDAMLLALSDALCADEPLSNDADGARDREPEPENERAVLLADADARGDSVAPLAVAETLPELLANALPLEDELGEVAGESECKNEDELAPDAVKDTEAVMLSLGTELAEGDAEFDTEPLVELEGVLVSITDGDSDELPESDEL